MAEDRKVTGTDLELRRNPTLGFVCCLFIGLTCAFSMPAPGLAQEPEDPFTPPADLTEGWYARIETTRGRILARLFPEKAPQAVAHFAGLAQGTLGWDDRITGEPQKGHYYDGTRIHLAHAGRRFEAGKGDGEGKFAPKIFIPYERGGSTDFSRPWRLGMARVPRSGISGVMFTVTASPMPMLNGLIPCFGEVASGKDVVTTITGVKTQADGSPVDPIIIEKIRIFPVGDPAPLPAPVPFTPSRIKLQRKAQKP